MIGSINAEVNEDEGYCIKDTVLRSVQMTILIHIEEEGVRKGQGVL